MRLMTVAATVVRAAALAVGEWAFEHEDETDEA